MHLPRVEDEFVHERGKDTVCARCVGDIKVPMYKGESLARR